MKYALIALAGFIALLLLSWGMGWFGIFYTRTIGKGQENARREVFEQTQSYIEGKRQEAVKYRLEYMQAKDSVTRRALKMTIAQSFSNFDENLLAPELALFIKQMKYNQ